MDKQKEGIDSEEVKRKFKKFDIVEDYSDHHYSESKSSSCLQPPRDWAKKILKEWEILHRDLPDMIFVRVYEGRMDLLRAVIVGVEGTPYYDGLFFFDVCFPLTYPNDPPLVYYHSGGLQINPNLYYNGKVCLSLLNTWIGAANERWRPDISTMLQVLVSIQGMILNAKPYFNEPLVQFLSGTAIGEKRSQNYNQNALLYSLKTMVYTINKPPKNFEDVVIGHFHDRANSILTSCTAYYAKGMGVKYGVNVGSLKHMNYVEGYMKTLVRAFKQIGVEDVDDFVPQTGNKVVQLQKRKENLIQKIMSCLCI